MWKPQRNEKDAHELRFGRIYIVSNGDCTIVIAEQLKKYTWFERRNNTETEEINSFLH